MAKLRAALDIHPFAELGKRDDQQDFFYTDPPLRQAGPWLGVLADGMGGHEDGEVASKQGVLAIKQAFDASGRSPRNIGKALTDATRKGHESVLRVAEKKGTLGNMGSTVVSFVIDGSTLYWCAAGDSRLYLFRDDKLVQLTHDFTVREDMRRGESKGDWTTAEIENSPQGKALTSFMGTDDWRTDDGNKPLRDRDVIVVCSDGVYGTIESEGIATACRMNHGKASAQQIAENMYRRVLDAAKPKQDNATAIIVRFMAEGGATGDGWLSSTMLKTGAAVIAVLAIGGLVSNSNVRKELVSFASPSTPASSAPTASPIENPSGSGSVVAGPGASAVVVAENSTPAGPQQQTAPAPPTPAPQPRAVVPTGPGVPLSRLGASAVVVAGDSTPAGPQQQTARAPPTPAPKPRAAVPSGPGVPLSRLAATRSFSSNEGSSVSIVNEYEALLTRKANVTADDISGLDTVIAKSSGSGQEVVNKLNHLRGTTYNRLLRNHLTEAISAELSQTDVENSYATDEPLLKKQPREYRAESVNLLEQLKQRGSASALGQAERVPPPVVAPGSGSGSAVAPTPVAASAPASAPAHLPPTTSK